MDLNASFVDLLNKSIFSEEIFNLIRLGANPNLLNKSGYSLLHLLIFNKRMTEAFELVEKYKANINLNDSYGYPPLYYMLNDKYPVNQIANMVWMGAHPSIKNKQGKAPIHFLIRDNFISALKLLNLHPESVHFKDDEGTPLQIMLNMRHSRRFRADNYLSLVRFGANPETIDNKGVSLLEVITQTKEFDRAKELIALSKISLKERIYYTPEIVDYYLSDEGLDLLVHDLKTNKFSPAKITTLAKYPLAKEMLVQFIKTLDEETQAGILKLCFKPNSSFHQFFSVQRGWFLTKNNRGSFAQLAIMQKNLPKDIEPDSEEESDEELVKELHEENRGHFCCVYS